MVARYVGVAFLYRLRLHRTQLIETETSMSTTLIAPDRKAPTSDWVEWTHELKSMPDSADVRKALREAEAQLRSRRHQLKPLQTPSPYGRHAF